MKSELKIHEVENNPESQSFRDENEQMLSECCMKVLRILNTGKRLTTMEASAQGIPYLPIRIKDLREKAGIEGIKDDWVRDANGKRLHKEWWLEITKRPTKTEILEAFNKGELKQGRLL